MKHPTAYTHAEIYRVADDLCIIAKTLPIDQASTVRLASDFIYRLTSQNSLALKMLGSVPVGQSQQEQGND